MQFDEFEELLWKWGAKQQDDSGLGWRGASLSEHSGAYDFKSTVPYFEEEVSRVEAIIERYAARPENGDRAKALAAKYGASRDFYDATKAKLSATQIAIRLRVDRKTFERQLKQVQDAVFTAYLERWVYPGGGRC